MKISTLITREPFKNIFQKTIEEFLFSYTNKKHEVTFDAIPSNDTKSSQLWHCNPLINSIFIKNVSVDVFNSINGEYAYNPMKPWRSIIQKLYLFFSQSKVTSTFFAPFTLSISPPIEMAENKLFIGGNTKIRLVDCSNNKVFVILKNGFDVRFIEKELFVKEHFSYLPVPKIIDIGSQNFWYSEEYVEGKPPNRLPKAIGNKNILESIECLKKVYKDTKNNISLHDYTKKLQTDAMNSVKNIPNASEELITNIDKIIVTISSALNDSENTNIALAYAHGDFHQGNILSNGNKFWILDWEHSGEKHICYDLVVFLLQSRIESGFSKRFSQLSDNTLDEFHLDICSKWPNINWHDIKSRKIYLLIFLLEDLNFYIEENLNPIFYKKENILMARCNEIFKSIEYLQVHKK
tara:strand:- start:128 stop:1351 length:1224 start_codon:yes stop_codon:yes gene_type:complete